MSSTETLAPLGRIGLLVPSFNSAVEPELARLTPPGLTNQTARFDMDATLLENVLAAAARVCASAPRALVFGLSTDSLPGGLAASEKIVAEVGAQSGLPVAGATQAAHAALRELGVRKVGVLTPFDEAANQRVRDATEEAGFEVVGLHGLAVPTLDGIGRVPLDELRAGFERADHDDAEALVQIGTGLPSVGLVPELEARHGKPVVACNAASYWMALRAAGIADRLEGRGRLFEI